MSAHDAAPKIRATLRTLGWTSRDVSVRADGCSVRVLVRNAAAPYLAIDAIARQYERIDRDYATGEILSGGNTFVNVDWSGEVEGPLVEAILARMPPEDATSETADEPVIGGWIVLAPPRSDPYMWSAVRADRVSTERDIPLLRPRVLREANRAQHAGDGEGFPARRVERRERTMPRRGQEGRIDR